MRKSQFPILLIMAFFLVGCAKDYAYKPIPVKDVSAYPNHSAALGARIGAEAFYDESILKEMFGFNLKGAGVVPVQVVIDNGGRSALGLAADARVLDAEGNWWDMLPENVVHDRVGQYVGGVDGGAAAKKSLIYGLAGAVVGAAVGVVTGTNVGEAAGKGAAVGAATGAAGEVVFGDENKAQGQIARDFSSREMAGQAVPAGTSAHGFLYFPAEMKKPVKLRLSLRQADGKGETAALELNL